MFGLFIIITLVSILSGYAILPKVSLLNQAKHNNSLPRLSIIIPARNEAHNLPKLLNSLQNQTLKPLEIIVVDDTSEDQTAVIARELNAIVVQSEGDENGWFGKSAACWTGAQAAQGDWFLFLDADIILPDAKSLARIVKEYHRQNGQGIMSIQPYHVISSLYENLSVIFNIMVLAGMNQFSVLGKRLQPAGAFGPSLLTDRKSYFLTGGHKSVKDSIMENVALGQIYLDHHLPVNLYSGKNCLHFRMYPEGLKELIQGWSKSFASASVSTHPFIVLAASLWIAGAFIIPLMSALLVISGNWITAAWAASGYLLYYFNVCRMARLAGNFNLFLLLFYPVFFMFFACLYAWSAIKTYIFGSVEWKGRKIKL